MSYSNYRERKYAGVPLSVIIMVPCIAALLVCLPGTVSNRNPISASAYAESLWEPSALISSGTLSAPPDEKTFFPPEQHLDQGLPCDESGQQAGSPATESERQEPERSSAAGEKQSAAPGEQKPEDAQAAEAQKDPDTVVDRLHGSISRSIQGTATWMDSFFGDSRYESELNESYVRFRYNLFFEDGSGAVREPDFQVRMVLPQLREKTHLVFTGAPRERSPYSALQSDFQPDQSGANEERNVTAALHQTLLDSARHSFIIRSGLKLHSGSPALVLGPRYRLLFPLDHWNLRFVEEVLWRSDTGWEAESTVDFEKPLPNGLFFRASHDWIWEEQEPGVTYAFNFYLGQPITRRRGLEYEWVNVFNTRPVNALTEITLRVRYRQQFWRDWLFFEISPQYRFPRDRSFDATPGILFRIEMLFGKYARM